MTKFYVFFVDPPSAPIITGYVEGSIIPAGTITKLLCVSTGGNPLATLTWYKNDKKVCKTNLTVILSLPLSIAVFYTKYWSDIPLRYIVKWNCLSYIVDSQILGTRCHIVHFNFFFFSSRVFYLNIQCTRSSGWLCVLRIHI